MLATNSIQAFANGFGYGRCQAFAGKFSELLAELMRLFIFDVRAHRLLPLYPSMVDVFQIVKPRCCDSRLIPKLRNHDSWHPALYPDDRIVNVSQIKYLDRHSRGGQFVAHVAALPGNPYDGHTLATVIPAMQAIIGNTLDRVIADAGYRGHNASPEYQFKVYTAGQKRRITPQIKRDMRRRAAVEPVIGHLKEDHRMGRNYLAHSSGDAINAVLAAVGYNFRLLLRWLRLLLFRILIAIVGTSQLRFS